VLRRALAQRPHDLFAVFLALQPAREQRAERNGAVDQEIALPVDGDDVIAVVEHQRVDQSTEMALQILGVAQARQIVLARLDDECRRGD
jgi:hypothetical protein